MDGKRGWLVVVGCFLTLVFTAGVSFFVLPVLMGPIIEDTGWSLVEVSFGVTLWGASAAILSPFCGLFIDRMGARRSILFGTAYTALGTFIISRVTSLTQFYAVMFFIPFGPMLSTYIPVGAIVPRWFVKHRGTATGLAMVGIGIGGAIFPLVASGLLRTHDWRGTYAVLSAMLLIALVPTFFFIRNPNAEEQATGVPGNESENESSGDTIAPLIDHLTLPQALKTRSFWGLGMGDALTGIVYAIFNVQLVFLLTGDFTTGATAALEIGEIATKAMEKSAADSAALVFSVFLLFTGLGTIPIGWLSDKLPFKRVFIACYLFPAVGALFLFPREYAFLAFGFAFIAGNAAGGRSALYPIALTRSFGELHIASIWGASNSLFMIGTALGPLIGSLLFEKSGGTGAVYMFCIGTLLVSTTLVSIIRREKVPSAA